MTVLTVVWLAGYAVARLGLTVVDVPMSAMGPDLVMLTGSSGIVVLVLAIGAVVAQFLLQRGRPARVSRLTVAIAGAGIAATLMGAAALILLDLVSGVLPGLGMDFQPLGALSRLGCVVAASLVALHTWRFWNATHGDLGDRPPPRETPGWVVAVGYAAVAACLVRLAAQLVVGLDTNPLTGGPSMIVFEVGFLLAGILLPLALVHRWGRIWPAWVPLLRGRRVPRRLLIGCGSVLGVTMVAYFGVMTGQMVLERLQGRNPFPPSGGLDLPEPFFWVSVPAYLVWGVGLVIGTLSYARVSTTVRIGSAPAERVEKS
ncbi:hypothetical protein J4H86_19800 [Spiractinospora alimapuensis]|nr:hypothetical protein J4H86_19800 [Spiractinospora alimapuensis]